QSGQGLQSWLQLELYCHVFSTGYGVCLANRSHQVRSNDFAGKIDITVHVVHFLKINRRSGSCLLRNPGVQFLKESGVYGITPLVSARESQPRSASRGAAAP